MRHFGRTFGEKKSDFNPGTPWFETLKSEYCKNAKQKQYRITSETIDKVLKKLQNDKAPGTDLIVGFWYKNLMFYKADLVYIFQNTLKGHKELPSWLTRARTQLLPKNENTHIAKNYRPIACQNLMFKLYTSCINTFVQQHCEMNNIVTTEQAGGKRGDWGCLEQLLINKTVLNEVKQNRRNLVTVWLDYQKAFDSVPHEWLIESLKLAKLPPLIVTAIDTLTKSWATNIHISGENVSFTSNLIEYKNGIFQGDGLSVLLFILSMNPLYFMLNRLKGYSIGKGNSREINITHLFFVDDLKLFAPNMNSMKLLLDLVTQFSKDIGMKFGESKCAYLQIERGRIKVNSENIKINNLNIQQVKEGESYKYLGIDENISFDGTTNKERVLTEYFKRVRKIWSSELSGYNKFISHNAFAVPVLIPTFGLLDWTIDEIDSIDKKTRKILTMTGNFHKNSDIDRFYMPRKLGGRGIKEIMAAYECRIVSAKQHLTQNKKNNKYLSKVIESEENGIIRIANDLIKQSNIEVNENLSPRDVGQLYQQYVINTKSQKFTEKQMHGYLFKKVKEQDQIDKSTSWTTDKYITSHFEGYAFAIHEQEINTKDLQYRRDIKSGKTPWQNNKCRLCNYCVEDITHVISSCSKMSSRYYLPLRHDVIAKTVYNEILRKENPDRKKLINNETEFITTVNDKELWWNVAVKTSSKVPHNRADMIVWDMTKKLCYIIEFSCPADINIVNKVSEKENIYGPLIRNMQMMYENYSFMFIPIIVGAIGHVPKCIFTNIENLGFTKNKTRKLVKKLQVLSVTGTVKICKTFMSFKV